MMTAEQLKGSILQLAMQGKLVEQRVGEGTGEELYKEIQTEKKRLLKEGALKKQKPLPEIMEEEKPFDIPESWIWVKLGDISSYAQPKEKVSPKDITPEMWSLDLEDIEKGTGKVLNHVLAKERKIQGDKVRFKKGNILYSKLRPYLLKILIADNEGITTPELVPFNIYGIKNSNFFLWYLRSPYVDNAVNSVSYGVKMPRVGTDTMVNLLVPLPPLAEQKRIVAKIEELMPFVEQYAAANTKLNTLNTNFPEMMKKSILQEAVQGKLVPQDPNDEPASVLLKKIAEEKKRLIKEGKFKKQKPLPEIMEDEIPFDIPNSWEWVRLGDLISIKSGEGLTSSNMKEGAIPVYGGNGITGFHNEALVHEETVVIGRVGYYCGSVHVTESEAWVTDNAFITTYPYECLNREYLVFVLRHMDLGKDNNATAQPVVSGKKIYPKLFPLPPLSEQKRIANKIKGLLSQVEKLVQ